MKTRSSFIKTALALTLLAAARPLKAQDWPVLDLKQWRGIAHLKSLKTGGTIKKLDYTVEAKYPVFEAKGALENFANSRLRHDAIADFNDFAAQARQEMRTETVMAGYSYASGPILSYYKRGRVISLTINTSRYMGGAHGIELTEGQTFAVVNGKPKLINLGDLFAPGSAYQPLVIKLILAKLKKDERAEWIADGTVKTVTPEQLGNFALEKDGLRWTFNPYEMGSYAAGPIDVKLTISELGPNLRKSVFW